MCRILWGFVFLVYNRLDGGCNLIGLGVEGVALLDVGMHCHGRQVVEVVVFVGMEFRIAIQGWCALGLGLAILRHSCTW